MSSFWFLNGVKKGIKTERFPYTDPTDAPEWPSRLIGEAFDGCPANAITQDGWIEEKCIFCRRCLPAFRPTGDQDIFTVKKTERTFRRSFNIFPLDSGACGSCNMEFFSIFSPQYDANRLGIFLVNTPRHADAIVVFGVMTETMQDSLKMAIEAMPEPKLVIALGACAITGGIFGEAPLGREEYHVEIAGCPPSPYSILSALNAAMGGRKRHKDPEIKNSEVP